MKPPKDDEFGSKGREADYFSKLRRLLAKMEPGDQKLLLHMAQKVAERLARTVPLTDSLKSVREPHPVFVSVSRSYGGPWCRVLYLATV